jgi:hypothetical protein
VGHLSFGQVGFHFDGELSVTDRDTAKESSGGFTKTNQFWTVAMTHMKDFFQEFLTNLPLSNFSFGNIRGSR